MKKQNKRDIETFKLGNKIKDIKVNQKQHFLLFVTLLVLFNVLLCASLIFLLVYLQNVVNWIICIISLLVCGWFSFKLYRDLKNYHKCTLYDNALVVDSIWLNVVIPLKNIYEIKVKQCFLDKIFKLNTYSLDFRMLRQCRTKFTLFFVEEDALKLKEEITNLIYEQNDTD